METKETKETYRDIYDRVAKRCLSISTGCTVSLINGLFGTGYPADSEVIYNWTENVDDGMKKTLADTIVTINGVHSYHCEFQMSVDGKIILRVLEYGFRHAMRSRTGLDVLEFPEPMVVYLYDEPIPEEYCVLIRFGTQGEFRYNLPVYPYLKRTQEDPAERNRLIVLLPFQLLRLRRAIEEERTEENKEALKNIITHDIVNVLERNVSAGNITEMDAQEIIELAQQLYEHIYGKYAEEMTEVSKTMNDALVLPSDKYKYQIRKLEEEMKGKNKRLQEQAGRLQEQAGQLQEQAGRLQEQAGQLQEQADEITALRERDKEKAEQIADLKRQLEALRQESVR